MKFSKFSVSPKAQARIEGRDPVLTPAGPVPQPMESTYALSSFMLNRNTHKTK